MAIPARVAVRLVDKLKQFQGVIDSAKLRDANESDTVIIVTDMLSDMFGYDKYSELTSEFEVRGTYCDLATKIDETVECLIEVKAVNTDLKDLHSRQAINYAANKGTEWVVLTNAAIWKVYRVGFSKPIDPQLVIEFDITQLSPRRSEDTSTLFLLAKEGFRRSALGEYSAQREALSRFCIGAMLLSDTFLHFLKRNLRRLSPDVRIDTEQIRTVLVQEVLKRDVLEGDKAEEAKKRVARSERRLAKAKAATESETSGGVAVAEPKATIAKAGQ
jgi:hypothetical protein